MKRLTNLIKNDNCRLDILRVVESLELPDCYIGAGFVRNLVWDHLHGFSSTKLNDVDIIYYSPEDVDERATYTLLGTYSTRYKWDLKNQARMHKQNGDPPYISTEHAMYFWPEYETAIGVRLTKNNEFKIISPFGIDSLFSGLITRNPKRSVEVFLGRINSKNWLEHWPNLKVKL